MHRPFKLSPSARSLRSDRNPYPDGFMAVVMERLFGDGPRGRGRHQRRGLEALAGLVLVAFLACFLLLAPQAQAQGAVCDLTEADIPSGVGLTFTIPAGQTLCAQTSVDRSVSLTLAGTLRVEPGVLLNINGSFANQGLIVFEADSGGMTSAIGLNGSMSCAGGSIEVQGAPVGETLDFPLFSQFFPGSPFPEFSNGYQPFVPNSSGFVGLTFASACQAVGVSSTPDPLAPQPFTCTPNIYLSQGNDLGVDLFELTFPTGDTELGAPIRPAGVVGPQDTYNAIGFREQDGLIYGLNEDEELVSVDATGQVRNLGAVSGLPMDSRFTAAGTVGPDGRYYFGSGSGVVIVDIDSRSVVDTITSSGFRGADFVIDQSVFFAYAVAGRDVIRMSLTSLSGVSRGTVQTLESNALPQGAYGAQYLDTDNRMFVSRNQSGDIYEISLAIDPANGLPSGAAQLVANGSVSVSRNDGAFCPGASFPIGAPPTGIKIQAFDDANNNQVREPSEQVFPDLEFVLDDGANVILSTAISDAEGQARLNNLAPGSGRRVRMRRGDRLVTVAQNVTIAAGTSPMIFVPIDPSGRIYDADSRDLIEGATLQLTDDTGVPLPDACLSPASQQGQTTAADGFYRFDVVPGADAACPAAETEYRIAVTPPSGFEVPPSSMIAPEVGPFNPVGTTTNEIVPNVDRPQGGDPTTYYLNFLLGPGDPDVVNNHIPLDVSMSAVSSLPTFTCSANFYEVISGDLHVLNVSTGVYDPIGPDHPELNGAGYNVSDDYIYLVDHDQASATRFHLYRMGSNGQVEDLGNVGVSANAGDMGPDDKLYLKDGNNSLHVVDVLTRTVTALNFTGTTGGSVLDFSYIDNGASEAMVGASNGSIRFYNLTTGVAGSIPVPGLPTSPTRYGATWSTSNGNLFISENGSGTITEIADPLGSPTIIGTFAAADTSNHDGANCYNASSPLGLPSDRSDAPITGTAPDGVGTIAYGDAEHSVGSGLRLGAVVDADIGAIASPDATGDGADDDGVASFPTLTEGDTSYTMAVSDFNAGAGDGTLYAWVDFDGDGAFEASEFASATYTGGAVQDPLDFSGFGATMSAGTTFARFRLTSDTLTSADFEAMVMDGEVEDYAVTVVAAAPIVPSCSVAQAVTESAVPTRTLNTSCSANVGLTSDGVTGNPGYCPNTPLPAGYEIAYDYVLPTDNQMYALTVWANAGGAFGDAELRSFDLEVDYTPVGGGTATLVMNNVNLGDTTSINDPKSVPFAINGQAVSLPNVSQVRISNLGSVDGSPVFREVQGVCGEEFSDAPATYAAASHEFTPSTVLGSSATPDLVAVNDDSDADDGVVIPTLRQDGTATITASVLGAGGFLQAWIDFDGSGTFEAGEQVAVDLQDNGSGGDVAANDGMITFDVTVPFDAVTVETYARFRWSSLTGLDASAAAPDGEVEDYAVTIEVGSIPVTGTVFYDNGTGAGATAHNGLIEGDEAGAGGTVVEAVDTATGTVVGSVEAGGDGVYVLNLPSEQIGRETLVRTIVPGGSLLVSNVSAQPPVSVDPADGMFVFTPIVGGNFSGLDFGLAEAPRLTEDQSRAIAPGGVTSIAHTFTAETAMDLTLTLGNIVQSVDGTFTASLFSDADCNGVVGTGDGAVTGTVSVVAGEQVCVLVRVVSALEAVSGAVIDYDLEASATYTGLAPYFDGLLNPAALSNSDRVVIADGGSLLLTKEVCNTALGVCDSASGAGFDLANSGSPRDVLIYRIVFEVTGPEPVDGLEIVDKTPAYSSLTANAPSVIAEPDGVSCVLSDPAAPVMGYEGLLEWTCTGTSAPGSLGIVGFEVRIAD